MSAVLRARQVGVSVSGRVLFDGVDLEVASGESVAVTGPSGSGKSSLLAVLGGLSAPSRGQIEVNGVEPGRRPTPADGVALVLQGYGLVSLLSAAENVEVALMAAGRTRAEARRRAGEALGALGLGPQRDQLVETLSGGQQQRTAVARALALQPRLLIADEPTAELDPASRVLALSRMFDAAADGCALILATHDPEVADMCDKSVILAAVAGPSD